MDLFLYTICSIANMAILQERILSTRCLISAIAKFIHELWRPIVISSLTEIGNLGINLSKF